VFSFLIKNAVSGKPFLLAMANMISAGNHVSSGMTQAGFPSLSRFENALI
jgi:hypothetical protein